ncbi:polysaccharide deacetylase family protein [Hyphomonas sp.]|uniref:polysaccharide deacetylase family protein n=1 Tax=Hyphomonas sp. TaxID=87 RepID=UPI0030F7FF63
MKKALKSAIRRTGLTRSHVASCRLCCERNILAALGRARKRYIGRILCYHTVGQTEWGVNDVTPDQFRRQLERALNAGFNFVPAGEIVRTGGGPKDLAITFDDGLKSVLTNAAPILKDLGLPWTFFPVSEWSEGRHWMPEDFALSWKDIETLLAAGADMGSHSATHPQFNEIGVDQMVDELAGSREVFRKRLGFAPDTFAIPFGQSGNWTDDARRLARDAGYSTIYAQAEETRPQDTVARTFVTKYDGDFIFDALLKGKFDSWEEWF